MGLCDSCVMNVVSPFQARNSFKKSGLIEKLESASLQAKHLYPSPSSSITTLPGSQQCGLLNREQCMLWREEAFKHVLRLIH
jgi:hypothetical protein